MYTAQKSSIASLKCDAGFVNIRFVLKCAGEIRWNWSHSRMLYIQTEQNWSNFELWQKKTEQENVNVECTKLGGISLFQNLNETQCSTELCV